MTAYETELRDAWRHLVGARHTDALERLLGRYREPHRRYHTIEHVAWVLRHIASIGNSGGAANTPDDLPAVLLAALYHDAVYDPTATGPAANEIASAGLAGACATTFGWSDERAEHVERLVFLTAEHVADSRDAAVLLDADLAILGAEPAAYAASVQQIREEYRHVPDELWPDGRRAVLQHFLSRASIYSTPFMHAQREARARANITAELASLAAS